MCVTAAGNPLHMDAGVSNHCDSKERMLQTIDFLFASINTVQRYDSNTVQYFSPPVIVMMSTVRKYMAVTYFVHGTV